MGRLHDFVPGNARGYARRLRLHHRPPLPHRASGPVLIVTSLARLDPGQIHGHGLNAIGLDPASVILVEAGDEVQAHWAIEEAFKSGVPAAVAALAGAVPDLKTSQRLHLAAGKAGLSAAVAEASGRRKDRVPARRAGASAAPGRARPLRPHRALALARALETLPQWPAGRMVSGVGSCRASFQSGCRDGRSCASSQAQARNPSPAEPVDPERPFILAERCLRRAAHRRPERGGRSAGLRVGDRVADARAKAGGSAGAAADPAADHAALRRLALWATRYTPAVSPWGEENGADGFFLDVTGAAHLFGGEADAARRSFAAARTLRPARRGWRLPIRPARPGRCRIFIRRRSVVCLPGEEAQALAALADRGAAAFARHAHHLAAARLQARRRA